jgi:glyoxylase I family protein
VPSASQPRGVDHLDLVVTDLQRSLDFYNGLLAPLGFTRNSEIEGERGERVVYIGGSGGASVSLRAAQSDAHAAPYDRYAVGVHHVAFSAESHAVVDERAAWLRERGVEIESGPRTFEYTPGYYAVFFYDPDGIKLEIVHRPAV